jgi:uncharacterized protein involved in tellurium resistance
MRKKDKVMVVMIRNGEQVGRFRAYLAWSDGRKGRLFSRLFNGSEGV